jgi:hypothetical protein
MLNSELEILLGIPSWGYLYVIFVYLYKSWGYFLLCFWDMFLI